MVFGDLFFYNLAGWRTGELCAAGITIWKIFYDAGNDEWRRNLLGLSEKTGLMVQQVETGLKGSAAILVGVQMSLKWIFI